MSIPERHLPPASPNKPSHSRGAPVYIHVEADEKTQQAQRIVRGAATPPRNPTRAPMPSLANSPSGISVGSQGSLDGAATPTAAKPPLMPPSSTKRLLAPNGQPRKIPMAMDFDAVDVSAALEDREMVEGGHSADMEDSWRVGSQPAEYYSSGSRVGALAAAAGRGASAFVEAFRSAVGAHRTSYSGSRRA